jgi:hypothetical protein
MSTTFGKRVDKFFHKQIQRVICFDEYLRIAKFTFFILQEILKTHPVLEAVK